MKLYALFVYILLYSLIILSAHKVVNRSCKERKGLWACPETYCIILIYTIVVGLRWMVGLDYENYYDWYNQDYGYYNFDSMELIPRVTMLFMYSLNMPFYTWFMLMAFLQIFFILKAFEKEYINYLTAGLFFYLVFYLGHDMNIIRQGVSLSIVAYAYSFLSKKTQIYYVALVILACLFHRSAALAILFVFLPLIRNISMPPVAVQLIFFFVLSYLGTIIINYITDNIGQYLAIIDYQDKLAGYKTSTQVIENKTGLGVLFRDFITILIILNSNKYLKTDNLKSLYIVYFIGACLYHACMNEISLSRINIYMITPMIVLLPVIMSPLLRSRYRLLAYLVYSVSISLILLETSNIEWNFVWDI